MLCNMLYPTSFLAEDFLHHAAQYEWQRRQEERLRLLARQEEQRRQQERARLAEAYRQQYVMRAFASAAAQLEQERQRHAAIKAERQRRAALRHHQQQQEEALLAYFLAPQCLTSSPQRHQAASHPCAADARQQARQEEVYAMLLDAAKEAEEGERYWQRQKEVPSRSCAMQAVDAPKMHDDAATLKANVEAAAAAKIQSVCCDYLHRQREAKANSAASTIQAVWRRYQKKRAMAPILPSLHTIKAILEEVNNVIDENKTALLSPLSATFDADRQKATLPFVEGPNKAVLTAEERLTTLLIKLDAVDTCDGNATVRAKRKYVIGRIEEYLRVIEQKKQLALASVVKPTKAAAAEKEPKASKRKPETDADIDAALSMEEQYLRKAARGLKTRRRHAKSKKAAKITKHLLF